MESVFSEKNNFIWLHWTYQVGLMSVWPKRSFGLNLLLSPFQGSGFSLDGLYQAKTHYIGLTKKPVQFIRYVINKQNELFVQPNRMHPRFKAVILLSLELNKAISFCLRHPQRGKWRTILSIFLFLPMYAWDPTFISTSFSARLGKYLFNERRNREIDNSLRDEAASDCSTVGAPVYFFS